MYNIQCQNRGETAVPRRSLRCRGDPTADWPNPRWSAEVLNMFKVSAVPPRRSAVLTVFRGATAITDGTTAEPRRSWRCHCGLCRTSTAVAPRLRCDGGITHDMCPITSSVIEIQQSAAQNVGRKPLFHFIPTHLLTLCSNHPLLAINKTLCKQAQ